MTFSVIKRTRSYLLTRILFYLLRKKYILRRLITHFRFSFFFKLKPSTFQEIDRFSKTGADFYPNTFKYAIDLIKDRIQKILNTKKNV
jgi:hypothetical protein